MLPAQAAPAEDGLLSRLGIPRLNGNGKFVTATAIDSIGTGLILAFTVVYFVKTTAVPLAEIGVAMTAARLLALPTPVLVGPLLDRFTARRTAAIGNLISCCGYIGFLGTHHVWSIVLVAFLVQVGHSTYWTSSAALVAMSASAERRPRWFGFVYALRNTGMGIGGAFGAMAFAFGAVAGLHLIALGNAVSFAVAALMLSRWHPKPVAEVAATANAEPVEKALEAKAGYRTVLADRQYAMLFGVNVTLVFAQMLIKVLLAIYIVEALHRGAWIAGTLILISTVQIALTQTVISRRMETHKATLVVKRAAVLNAISFLIFAGLYYLPGEKVVLVGLFVAMALFTTGEIIGFPAMDNLSVAMAPEQIRGRYLAVYQLSWTLGEVLAPAVLTVLLAWHAALPMVFLMVLSLVAIPLLGKLEGEPVKRRFLQWAKALGVATVSRLTVATAVVASTVGRLPVRAARLLAAAGQLAEVAPVGQLAVAVPVGQPVVAERPVAPAQLAQPESNDPRDFPPLGWHNRNPADLVGPADAAQGTPAVMPAAHEVHAG